MNETLSNYRLNELRSKLRVRPLDIMLVGVTGAGKSSTSNAIVGNDSAKVGVGVNPETQDFKPYYLNEYIRFWDTPGIGDSPMKDEFNMQIIASY
jgi:predicted GTPase